MHYLTPKTPSLFPLPQRAFHLPCSHFLQIYVCMMFVCLFAHDHNQMMVVTNGNSRHEENGLIMSVSIPDSIFLRCGVLIRVACKVATTRPNNNNRCELGSFRFCSLDPCIKTVASIALGS